MKRRIIARHYYNLLCLVCEWENGVDCRVIRDGRCLGFIIADNREQAIEKFNNREWQKY